MNEPSYQGGLDKEEVNEVLELMEVNYKQWAKYLAPLIMLNDNQTELADSFEELLCLNDPQIAREFAEVNFRSDVCAELKKLLVSTLIMQTRYDAIVLNIHAQIPDIEFIVMKAMGHNPHISDAEETVAVIKEYLDSSEDGENG